MKLAEVQKFLAKKITAAPALAAFGDPFLYNPQRSEPVTYDPDTDALVTGTGDMKDAIRARLQSAGVAIEIAWPAIASTENTVGAVFSKILVPMFAAELANHSHSPTGLALTDAIIAALKTRSGSAWVVDVTDYAFDNDEHGSVLHVLTVSIDTRH